MALHPDDEKALQAAVLDLASRVIALEKRLCVCDVCQNPLREVRLMGTMNSNDRPNAGHVEAGQDTKT